LVAQIIKNIKNINWSKKKMVDKIKMASKHEFSIAQSIFMQLNRNLGFEMNVLQKKHCRTFFQNFPTHGIINLCFEFFGLAEMP
jgi:hypothetical protein